MSVSQAAAEGSRRDLLVTLRTQENVPVPVGNQPIVSAI
jgi:hypothetical protein